MIKDAPNFQALVHRAENGEASAVRRATADYIKEMDTIMLRDYFHAAGFNAIHDGDGGAAWMLRGVVSGPQSYGQYLRSAATLLLFNNPRFLRHFSPDFTDGIHSRLD